MGEILKQLWAMLRTRDNRTMLRYAWAIEVPGRLGVLIRRRIMARQWAGCGENLGIRQGVYFRNPQNMTFGNNVNIGNRSMLQAGGTITIGDNVLLGPGVMIWTQSHRFERMDVPINTQGNEYQAITIGDDCWIGSNVFIMPGVNLPRGCIVAASSVVGVKPYKEFSILMGNPARLIGQRGQTKLGQPKPEAQD